MEPIVWTGEDGTTVSSIVYLAADGVTRCHAYHVTRGPAVIGDFEALEDVAAYIAHRQVPEPVATRWRF